MKLARVIRTGVLWVITDPYSIVNAPPVCTIVQYKRFFSSGYDVYSSGINVYFPGVQGCASMSPDLFDWYFEPL